MQALDKSKYRDGLRAVRRYIPRLEQDLELLQAQLNNKAECEIGAAKGIQNSEESIGSGSISNLQSENTDKPQDIINRSIGCQEDETDMNSQLDSDSENLSDIFETDSEIDNAVKGEQPLYMDEFEKFPVQSDGEIDDFEEHLRQISLNSKNSNSLEEGSDSPKLDEVDRIFLRAASLLKKKRK